MTFWRLHAPEYDSDYQSTYTNGSLALPWCLPGIACDVCGQIWSGSRILPYECQQTFRTDQRLNDRRPIPPSEHVALQQELMKALDLRGQPFETLRPGDCFQPCFLDVPLPHSHLPSSILPCGE